MTKLDLRKTLQHFYEPSPKAFAVIDVPAMNFLMIDGEGDPNVSPVYANAIQWLYGVSYTLKFASKATGTDYGVMPLEGLWWADDTETFITREKAAWKWTMMITQPDFIAKDMVAAAIDKTRAKLGDPPQSLRLERFAEGLSAQIMHIGPYDAEGPTIARLHKEFLPGNGLTENGHHHEIYLSDPRRTAPEKLRTVLRQPVRRL
ncbi:MAG: GyrI-like domain-containing protein [Phyllobacteriaceae bacterium]|nr:GyrI-like domain-containing protein [Phyllobacteriaceae bacterium]